MAKRWHEDQKDTVSIPAIAPQGGIGKMRTDDLCLARCHTVKLLVVLLLLEGMDLVIYTIHSLW